MKLDVRINDIKADVTLIADALRNMIIMSDTADIKKEAERIEAARKQIGQRFSRLEAQLTLPETPGFLRQRPQPRQSGRQNTAACRTAGCSASHAGKTPT